MTFSGFNLGILKGRDLTSRLVKKVGKSVISVCKVSAVKSDAKA